MTCRDKPFPPMLTIEFSLSEIDFCAREHEFYLEKKFRQLCKERLNVHMSDAEWPPADIWRAEVRIGRTNDTVWSYIQNMRDDILKLYKEVRND